MKSYVKRAIERIKRAEALSLKYSADGFFVAFSGGKDSQCVYHLCKMAGVKFTATYAVTTVDSPELVKFIKTNYPDVELKRPERTFYQLIIDKMMLPTRVKRFCCAKLKEVNGGESDHHWSAQSRK
jgi:3''-phosphoadenosine 5''-phosphosulfate sulfotransferase (PAPS reductase)/FAD synthetase and related enzymes